MSTTTTDVIVTQYRAEFRAAPFARPRWTITGGWEHRETLKRRRRWTVVVDYQRVINRRNTTEPARKIPDTNIGHIHESMLIDPDAIVVFVPDTQASRYGTAVVIEEKPR